MVNIKSHYKLVRKFRDVPGKIVAIVDKTSPGNVGYSFEIVIVDIE